MYKSIALICSLISLTAGGKFTSMTLPEGITAGIMDSPYYSVRTRSLYFISLFSRYVFRYSEVDDQLYYCEAPEGFQAGFFMPSKDDPKMFYGGFNNAVYEFSWDGCSTNCTVIKKLFTVSEGSNPNMNQAILGPNGEIYTGTVDYKKLCGGPTNQRFYEYTKKSGLKALAGKFKTTNSLAYDFEESILYHLDGCTQQLLAYHRSRTGALCGPWTILESFGIPSDSAPVGLVVLPNGHLRCSSYKLGILFTIDPCAKKIIAKTPLPTYYSAAIAFGGPDGNTLYLLSSSLDADILTGKPNNVTVPPPAGSLILLPNFGNDTRKPCTPCLAKNGSGGSH